jgi:SAM-dependent methyltransferase
LSVSAWDISAVAVAGLSALANAEGLPLRAEVRDVVAEPPSPDSFDVIVVSHYLERGLAPALIRALRPGGLLFYQTFTVAKVSDYGPRNPAFRLQANELLQLFADLQLLVYREEGRVGDTAQGFRDEAMLVAIKSP